MLQFADYALIKRVHEGNHSDVFLAEGPDGAQAALKIVRSTAGSSRKAALLQHEFALMSQIDHVSVLRPSELLVHGGDTALIMPFGGRSLADVLADADGHLDLERAIDIALRVLDALAAVHAANIIHKDVKPANVLVDDDGTVRLIDFSIATELSGQHVGLRDLHSFEGTLRYVSPEQTGRMNRSVDFRSDYYSLAVTLYEMIAGRVPFAANDAMKLVHCHLARRPNAPSEFNASIPACLDQVVLKLLSKTAEERYQGSQSLRRDLETCRGAVRTGTEPADFVPGRADQPDRLRLSQRLYGRDDDVQSLLAAFDRVAGADDGDGRTEMLLVAGYSGIGKSAIVNEVHKPIVARNGYFIAGKFDQFNRNIPYASLILASQSLVSQLLSESEDELAVWRDKLTEALGGNGQVIVNVIPEVELIIGRQPRSATWARRRRATASTTPSRASSACSPPASGPSCCSWTTCSGPTPARST